MSEIEADNLPSSRNSLLIGDTDAETLHNIGCVLQVLSDAAISELSSSEMRRGWWLLLQEISQVALESNSSPLSE